MVAGPGALDGLSKCFESLGDYSAEDTIRWLSEIQQKRVFRGTISIFDGLWDRPLQPIDVQNLFCEVSKYTRVTHPEFKGLSGRTRIKRRFKTAGTLPRPFFPPKWGINDRVEEWFVEQGANGSRGPEPFDLASPPSTLAPDNEESD